MVEEVEKPRGFEHQSGSMAIGTCPDGERNLAMAQASDIGHNLMLDHVVGVAVGEFPFSGYDGLAVGIGAAVAGHDNVRNLLDGATCEVDKLLTLNDNALLSEGRIHGFPIEFEAVNQRAVEVENQPGGLTFEEFVNHTLCLLFYVNRA